MDEDMWPSIHQPLALWSPSADDATTAASHGHPFMHPACSTPLASPIQQKLEPPVPPPTFGAEHRFDQQPYYLPPTQLPNPIAPTQNWTTGTHQPPYGGAVPPPPYFGFPPNQHVHHAPFFHQQQPPHQLPQFHSSGTRHGLAQSAGTSNISASINQGHPSLHQAQQQQQRDQRRCMASQQKVQQWQQFGTGQIPLQDSGVHSMSQSTANSVMSMSSIHPVSCISAVSSLPDEFPSLQEHPLFQHMPNGIRHEEPEKMRQVLPELIPLINDEAEEIVLRALTILCSITKKDKELATVGRASQLDRPLICERRVVEELLRTLRTHKRNKKVVCYALRALHFISDNEPNGRELFVQTLNALGTDCLEDLVHCIGIQEHSCFKYAFLVLHNLMSDARIGRKVIAYMCEMRVLTKVLGWLGDRNEKFLNIVIDIVHMLVGRNSEQMAFFLGLNGHQRLIQILAQSQQETLLHRAVKLLNRIVHMDPAKMVSAGLLEAVQKHLDMASQRLLRQTLDCVRAASHVPSVGHNVQPLLQKLLLLLGTSDFRVKESCMDILANLSANNAHNKEFLVESDAVFGIFRLLHELDVLRDALGSSSQREGIQERALALLKSLCSGNARAPEAKRQILVNDEHKRLLLERLRQQQHLPLLRRTLMLLQQLAQDELDLLCSLRFALAFPPPFVQLPDAPMQQHSETCSFVNQAVLLLHQSMASLPESAEICQRCLDILRAMARDATLLEEIFAELRARRLRLREGQGRLMAPQMLLCFYDQLAPNAVALMAELVRIPEAVQMLQRDQSTLDSLQRWANSDTPTAQLALRILQMIGTNGEQQQYRMGDCNGQLVYQHQQQYPQQCQQQTHQHPYSQQFDNRKEFPPALNDSPALHHHQQMDCSSVPDGMQIVQGTSRQSVNGEFGHSDSQTHSAQMPNGEQLAPFAQFPEFPMSIQQEADSFPDFAPSAGDDFSTDFGPFVNALCPPTSSSPVWAQARSSGGHCPNTQP